MQEKIAGAVELLDKYDHPYDIVYTNFVGKSFMRMNGR